MIPIKITEKLEGFRNITFAEDQPEYLPLPALVEEPKEDTLGAVITRWKPTPEELEKLVAGDDIFLEVWTFGNFCQRCGKRMGLQPIKLGVKLGVWSDRMACGGNNELELSRTSE